MFNHKHQHTKSPSQEHEDSGVHPHQHGTVDPSLLATERGIWAVKWSLVGLAATALFQVVVVLFSGSAALLADTVHNFGDAATAIPL
jgi:Co/Zn/Cd efflux system component